MSKKSFLIINGPNLNLLGQREPEIYGSQTLEGIKKYTEDKLRDYDVQIEWFQSNSEWEIVEKIQTVNDKGFSALIINPAAYSHTSVAIYDSLRMVKCPIIEVHLSNTCRRGSLRQTKLTGKASTIIMEGLREKAYFIAIYSQI